MRRPGHVALTALVALATLMLPAVVAAAGPEDNGFHVTQRYSAAAKTKARKRMAVPRKPVSVKKSTKPAKQTEQPEATKKIVPTWRFSRSLGAPTLSYGMAGDDEILFSFSCQPDSGLLRVISQLGSRGLRPGDGAPIRLSNGKLRFEIAGTAFSTEAREEVDIGGATRISPELFALFRGGEKLVVRVPGHTRSMPIANAIASAEAFQKACLAGAARQPAPTG